MADLSKSVEIIFNGVNNLDRTFADVEGAFGALDNKARSLAQPLADFTDNLLKVETGVVAVGAALVAVSTSKAGEFGASIEEIGTLFGGTNEQLDKFSGEVLDYAKNSTQSIESINHAIYEATSAGVDYSKSIDVVSTAEKLAVAGRADLTESTLTLVSTLNAYGESTNQAAHYSDVLFTAVKLGQTTVPELSQSLAQVTGIASGAKVPFETLAAAIAATTASGQPTAEAITGIRAAISNIIQPSSEAEKAAAALNVQFNAQALAGKGLDGVLKDVFNATGGNVDQMGKFFGSVEGLNTALVLGADKSGLFAKAMVEMKDSTGATDTAFAAMAGNYELAMQKIANGADVALIKFGRPLLDEFGGTANAIKAIFNGLGDGIDAGAFDPIINALEAFGAEAATVLGQIAQNLPEALEKLDFSGMVRSMEALGDEIGNLFEAVFGEIDLSTPEGVAEALQRVIDVITGLVNVTRGIVSELEPLFTFFGDLARETSGAGEEAQIMVGKFLEAANLVADFGAAIGGLSVVLKETGGDLHAWYDILAGVFELIVNGAQVTFDTAAGAVATFVRDVAEMLNTLTFGKFDEELGPIIDSMNERIDRFAENLVANSGDASEAIDRIGRGISGLAGDDQSSAVSKAERGLKDVGTAAGQAADETKKFEPIDLGDVDFVAEAAKRLGMNLADVRKESEGLKGATEGTGKDWATAQDYAQGYKKVVDELGNVTYVQVGNAMASTSKSLGDQSKKFEDAQKASEQYRLKMEEIASNERIKTIELNVQMNIADLEAGTERIKAAFASIDNTVTSTGDLIGDLLDNLNKVSYFDQTKIWDLIKDENRRRQEALDLQKELVEAQVTYLKRRAEALAQGDVEIKIIADELVQPLETIFHEILARIQAKANEEGLELLLGATA